MNDEMKSGSNNQAINPSDEGQSFMHHSGNSPTASESSDQQASEKSLPEEYLDYLHPEPMQGAIFPRGADFEIELLQNEHGETITEGYPEQDTVEKWSGAADSGKDAFADDIGVDGTKKWIKDRLGKFIYPNRKTKRRLSIEQVSLNQFDEIVAGSNGRAKTALGVRNVLLDFDGVAEDEPDEFLAYLAELEVPFSFAVFSGKKGVHVVISLRAPIADPELANRVCNALYEIIAEDDRYELDAGPLKGHRKYTSACRLPGLTRILTGTIQKLVAAWKGYVVQEDLEAFLSAHLPDWKTRKKWKIDKAAKTTGSFSGEGAFKALLEATKDWVHDQGHFWAWTGDHYRRLDWDEKEPQQLLWPIFKTTTGSPTASGLKDRLEALSYERKRTLGTHPELVNFNNGVLNLRTLELIPHSKDFRFNYVLPVAFEREQLLVPKSAPSLDRILQGHVEREEDRKLFKQFLGYILTDDRRKGQMLILYGPRDTGKSTILGLIEDILGKVLVAKESPGQVIRDENRAKNIIGKRVSIAMEAKIQMSDLEAFKALITFEELRYHIFHRGRDTTSHGCKFICAANDDGWLPNRPEILKRIRVVEFSNSLDPKHQDPGLRQRLLDEMSAIIHECLAAYREVIDDAVLAENQSTKEYLKRANENVNPIAAWLEDRGIAVGPNFCPTEVLFRCFRDDNPTSSIRSSYEFGKKLKDCGLKPEDSPRFWPPLGKKRRGPLINMDFKNGSLVSLPVSMEEVKKFADQIFAAATGKKGDSYE
ncbi:MAG TPA: DUF5906 domain-containing protein [Bdellovibrionota bacterium]|nr:DUF5906 domain-containing protein [Bdellovibrionota bacterium]